MNKIHTFCVLLSCDDTYHTVMSQDFQEDMKEIRAPFSESEASAVTDLALLIRKSRLSVFFL